MVLFQGHVYQCEHFEYIHGAFRWFLAEQLRNFKFYENLRPCEKTTKQIIFVVLFQGHVYQCKYFEHIYRAFCGFFAEKLRNFDFYENLPLNSSIFFYTGFNLIVTYR